MFVVPVAGRVPRLRHVGMPRSAWRGQAPGMLSARHRRRALQNASARWTLVAACHHRRIDCLTPGANERTSCSEGRGEHGHPQNATRRRDETARRGRRGLPVRSRAMWRIVYRGIAQRRSDTACSFSKGAIAFGDSFDSIDQRRRRGCTVSDLPQRRVRFMQSHLRPHNATLLVLVTERSLSRGA